MRTVTMRGAPLELEGNPVSVGQQAPDFNLLAKDMTPRSLKDYAGKILVIASVPSLDTGVCDMEVRYFNGEAAKLSKDIIMLAVSCDLPFAQARWCGAAGVDNVVTLSDHREASFGRDYGVLIKPLRLLARSVVVVNREGKITYVDVVNEVADQPDYDAVLEAAKACL